MNIYRTADGLQTLVGAHHDHSFYVDKPNVLPHRVKAYIIEHLHETFNQRDLRDFYRTVLEHFGPNSSQPLHHFDADPDDSATLWGSFAIETRAVHFNHAL